jgi:hypothetical protein
MLLSRLTNKIQFLRVIQFSPRFVIIFETIKFRPIIHLIESDKTASLILDFHIAILIYVIFYY